VDAKVGIPVKVIIIKYCVEHRKFFSLNVMRNNYACWKEGMCRKYKQC
jgi:hypothetical protein